MEINAVPFSPFSTLAQYDEWIRHLAYHELTHLVANDSTQGFFEVARQIFGSVAKINSYQPQWLVEGLAVYEETRLSSLGRGRSVFTDMIFRTAVRDQVLGSAQPLLGITLDRLSAGPPFWPGPDTPYLYGYLVEEGLAQNSGTPAPGQVSIRSAGTVPFFLDHALSPAFPAGYSALWRRSMDLSRVIAEKDLEMIRSTPVSATKALTAVGRFSGAPVIVGDQAYFIRDSYESGVGLSVLNLSTGKVRDLNDWYFGGDVSLRAAGLGLVYGRFDRVDEFKMFSDVYYWDKIRGEVRLTTGARALYPAASPDFELSRDGLILHGAVAYVKNLPDGNQALVVWDGKVERSLDEGKNFERLSYPAWSGSGATLAVSLKPNGRERDAGESILLLSAEGSRRRVISRGEIKTTLSFNAKGDLLFSSIVGGVLNFEKIKSADLARALADPAFQPAESVLTHLETGALFPVEDSSGRLYGALYSARGFDLARFDIAPASPAPITIRSSFRSKLGPELVPQTLLAPSVPKVPQSYSVLPTLWPKFWSPYFEKVTNGLIFGIYTSGADALDIHSYEAHFAIDTRASFPVYDLLYDYNGLYPQIQIERQRQNKYLGVVQASNAVDTTNVTIDYPIDFWDVTFGGTSSQSQFLGQSASSGGVTAQFSHTRFEVYPDSIDTVKGESGHELETTFTGYILGQSQYSSFEGSYEQRIPALFPRHFFRFFASGAHSNNPQLDSLYFVGGGETNISMNENYLIRGYVPGSIYGRDLMTFNLEYWLPLFDLYRGVGSLPGFYERSRLKLFVDTGTAEYVNDLPAHCEKWPLGAGLQWVQDLTFFYRYPWSLAVGFDHGFSTSLGGGNQVVVGLFSRGGS
jgi:hypothetical protein